MDETRYLISDASKHLGVESHVLRYWEEELGMHISRNELGHRYYSEKDIHTLECVKELKNQGFQLRAIKLIMPEMINRNSKGNQVEVLQGELEMEESMGQNNKKHTGSQLAVKEKQAEVQIQTDDKMEQFQEIMYRIISKAIADNNQAVGQSVGDTVSKQLMETMPAEVAKKVSGNLSKNISKEVSRDVVNALSSQMKAREKKQEAHYKQLDQMIRNTQKARKEVAAAAEPKRKKPVTKQKKRESLFGKVKRRKYRLS
jgi:DNA-binding transcriptional MerR regulator